MTTTKQQTRKSTRSASATAEQAETRGEKLAAIHKDLSAQVETLTTSDGWQAMLTAAAHFRTYSFANTMLLAYQLAARDYSPFTRVAGFQTWKSLGRTVLKGEKGLAILAPSFYRKDDDEATEESGSADKPRSVSGFRVVYVFAAEQTEGDPLPEVKPTLLAGEAPVGLWDSLAAMVKAQGFTVERGDCGHANGYTDPLVKIVRVRDDVEPAQACKTLAHELAHVLLHCDKYAECRDAAEVEAESIAYIITTDAGMDTSDYSTPYIAGWASDGIKTVKESAERVISTATRILNHIDDKEAK